MRRITKKRYPCVVVKNLAVLPGMVIHFDINTAAGAMSVERAMVKDRKLFAVAEKENDGTARSKPGSVDLFGYGCVCSIKQVVKLPGNVLRVLVEGELRAKLFDIEKIALSLPDSLDTL